MLRFFKPKEGRNVVPAESSAAGLMTAGKRECPYCQLWFVPQGFVTHIEHEVLK
jgi:hypothetical protein